MNQSTNSSYTAAHATHNGRSSNVPTDATQPSNIPGLSADQMQKLLNLLDSSSTSKPLMGKTNKNNVSWLLDSGASHHMTGTLSLLHDCHDLPPSSVSLPDGVQTTAMSEGSVSLVSGLALGNVLYVPNLKCSLISISKLIFDILILTVSSLLTVVSVLFRIEFRGI